MPALFALAAVLLFAQDTVTVAISEDVGVFWEGVTLRAQPAKGGPQVSLSATTASRGSVPYIRSLAVSTARSSISCPAALFADLPFPQLATLSLWYNTEHFEPRGPFSIRLQYGETPPIPGRADYVQVAFQVRGGKCTGRSFSVPIEGGGWQDQTTRP